MANATALPSRAPPRTPALDWPTPSPTPPGASAAPVLVAPRPPSSLPLEAGAPGRSVVDGEAALEDREAALSPGADDTGGNSTVRGSGRGSGSGEGRAGSGATGSVRVSTRRVSAEGAAAGAGGAGATDAEAAGCDSPA